MRGPRASILRFSPGRRVWQQVHRFRPISGGPRQREPAHSPALKLENPLDELRNRREAGDVRAGPRHDGEGIGFGGNRAIRVGVVDGE